MNNTQDMRGKAYRLLARLWLAEIDAPLAASLRRLPGFAAHIPAAADAAWLDEMAAEYGRVLAQNVYPYESMFVGDDLMLNTDATRQVEDLYNLAGYAPQGARVAALDHLGVELDFMAHLIAAADDGPDPAAARELQARFLAERLAYWAPVCALTVARLAPHPIYATMAQLTWELVLAESALPGPLSHGERDGVRVPTPGADPKTLTQPLPEGEGPDMSPSLPAWEKGPGGEGEMESLGQVARMLLTPARVGVFLCREDVRRIGRALGLPTPLGDRFTMLRALFEAAAQFDLLPALLAALAALWRDADAQVVALAAEAPAWAGDSQAWRERVAAGQALLDGLREALMSDV
ncbi:MAG: molecular chaperone TorD family protein [Anaerolineae bacterium]